ncbi:Fe2+-enterobactin ABC transporter substrate-binding protein [Vibrio mangrovi]|uniref:Fe2+-enterobactin ABC transporter substrate-binding protein n=1 Tax=Vibrio mangrovi TaxID=474394 RepID=A0A1Y6IUD9_9VIBR|nr:Fe2+-enterobactin ABC transporter substrate-binding protein [Vibrio mangrovi]MDW6003033.1 Fe2+-enterobactin ABC transporter substrate-binding protein [Vibrio mangrovi]SMS01275.1 Ferrienterobactin-binding periplasmic protein precursor [Vibrio mangrovi]
MRCQNFPRFFVLMSIVIWCSTSYGQAASWPRQIQTELGSVTLNQMPQRIVSTSVTLTGSLLAIDAPVVASGATTPNNRFSDEQGFFRQWSDVARQRQLTRLYIGEASAEKVAAMNPDLIIVSASGGDSALNIVSQLQQIAPTIVLDYTSHSWQELVKTLGVATGHEVQAKNRIDAFNQRLAEIREQIKPPSRPVSAFVYSAADRAAHLWQRNSAQGRLLEALGFQLALPTDTGLLAPGRHDIIRVTGEQLPQALNGETFLLFAADQRDIHTLSGNLFMRMLPAVKQNRVFAMGRESFRLDYYSASQLLTRLHADFAHE